MPTFSYTSGNPDNLVGGTAANMADIKGPLEDVKTFLNGQIGTSNISGSAAIAASQLAAAVQAALVPAGTVLATARSTAPTGYLLCDGSAVSRTTYADLFTAISTTYGSGDGSTTFNVPDLRGRVPVGVDGAAGRLSANDALGNTSGSETHTLTEAQLPSHHHVIPIVTGAIGSGSTAGILHSSTSSAPSTTTSNNAGSGSAHNNLQPYQIVNYMIKT